MSKGYSGLFKLTKGDYANYEIKYESSSKVKDKREPDFYVGLNKKALKAEHKKWIGVNRRDRLIKKAKHPKVKNLVNELYRSKSFIGDGGTASALKFERSTGLGLGRNGNSHIEKAQNTIRHINKNILTIENLSPSDRKLAIQLRNKLIKALGGTKSGK